MEPNFTTYRTIIESPDVQMYMHVIEKDTGCLKAYGLEHCTWPLA